MNNIDTFLSEWEAKSQPINNKRVREFGGLNIQLSKSGRDNTVRLNSIKSTNTRNGEASEFMKWLSTESDKGGFLVTLCAQQFGSYDESKPTKDQLIGWMKKFGFTRRYEYPDRAGVEMVRCPNGNTALNKL